MYYQYNVCLNKKCKIIARLVAEAFVENTGINPDGTTYDVSKATVDHINRNSADNRAENLQWVGIKYNVQKDLSKKVRDIDNNVIYASARDAAAALKLDLTRESISNAVYNRTTCNGYYFLKPDEDIYELLNSKSNKINLSKISIYRYTESGDFDCEFSCIQEAVNSGISRRTLKSAIENNKIAKGYRWSYEKSDKIKIHTPLKPVKIAQYDLNRNLIKIWDSVKDCKKEFPSCQKVCRKERKSTNGFIFEYIS